MKWMKLKITNYYKQDLTLATLYLKLDTRYSMTHCVIHLCKKNKIDQCQNEKECLQMWVASAVSVKVLQCIGW